MATETLLWTPRRISGFALRCADVSSLAICYLKKVEDCARRTLEESTATVFHPSSDLIYESSQIGSKFPAKELYTALQSLLTRDAFFLDISREQLQTESSQKPSSPWVLDRAGKIVRYFLTLRKIPVHPINDPFRTMSCMQYTLQKAKVANFSEMIKTIHEQPEETLLKNDFRNISQEAAAEGDLILYRDSTTQKITHMGLYLGNDLVCSKLGNKNPFAVEHSIEDCVAIYGDEVTFFTLQGSIHAISASNTPK